MSDGYELPTETGDQRLQRLRDRNHLWQQRGIVMACIAGVLVWWGRGGGFDEGRGIGLLSLVGVVVAYLLVEAILYPVEAELSWVLSPLKGIFRPLSSRGYSYYDEEEREDPAPDYSRAERIPEEYR